jgi:hypothetical protein
VKIIGSDVRVRKKKKVEARSSIVKCLVDLLPRSVSRSVPPAHSGIREFSPQRINFYLSKGPSEEPDELFHYRQTNVASICWNLG